MSKTRCPQCGSLITVEKPREGVIIECRRCGVELEIVRKDPLEVEPAGDWPDDWENDSEEDL